MNTFNRCYYRLIQTFSAINAFVGLWLLKFPLFATHVNGFLVGANSGKTTLVKNKKKFTFSELIKSLGNTTELKPVKVNDAKS